MPISRAAIRGVQCTSWPVISRQTSPEATRARSNSKASEGRSQAAAKRAASAAVIQGKRQEKGFIQALATRRLKSRDNPINAARISSGIPRAPPPPLPRGPVMRSPLALYMAMAGVPGP